MISMALARAGQASSSRSTVCCTEDGASVVLSLCKACVLGFKTMEGLLLWSSTIEKQFTGNFIALASKFEEWTLKVCVREDDGVRFTTVLQDPRNVGFRHVLYGALVELGGILGCRKWILPPFLFKRSRLVLI